MTGLLLLHAAVAEAVGGDVDDPTEETVVTVNELDVTEIAEEEGGEDVEDATKVADNTRVELETDDTTGWLELLHLDMEPTN